MVSLLNIYSNKLLILLEVLLYCGVLFIVGCYLSFVFILVWLVSFVLFGFIWWFCGYWLFYCLLVLGLLRVLFSCDLVCFDLLCCFTLGGWITVFTYVVLCLVFRLCFAGFVLLCNSVVCLHLRCSDFHLIVVFWFSLFWTCW